MSMLTNNRNTDPRERMLTVGNAVLDIIYELDATEESYKRIMAVKDDKEAFADLIKEEGAMEVLISRLTISAKKDEAVREYVTLRQTIEALTGGTK